MAAFRPGDWIQHRKGGPLYHILDIGRDGRLLVECKLGGRRVLTRPEEYRITPPPKKRAG
jgi:hypothetical protein